MKSKFFIISILFHMVVFIGFSKVLKNNFKTGEKIHNININFNITPAETNTKILTKTATKNKKIIVNKSKQIKNKTKPQKKQVLKRQEPKKQIVQKKIEVTKPKIVQSKKTKPEEKIEVANTGYMKSNKDQKEEQDQIVQNIPTENAVIEKEEIDKNLVNIKDGEYALKNQRVSGIHIVIDKEIPPTYPDLALKMGYKKETIVKVKFLVNKKGKVRDIKFYTSSKYGFENEVEKALKQWVFEPIIYRDKPMPIYFYKVFHFVSKG